MLGVRHVGRMWTLLVKTLACLTEGSTMTQDGLEYNDTR